ncbi:unnamed protein product [Closterium sp. NIES-53]
MASSQLNLINGLHGTLRDVQGTLALLTKSLLIPLSTNSDPKIGAGLADSLAPLPCSPALPCTPCVEGRQSAAPHSSLFPPTTAPLQTLHLDVWGPSPVLGPRQECYFLIVVDDYSCYTTVFPFRRKADVPSVLEPWLLASDARPRVTPIFLWTGFPGVAADYRVWGCLAHVRAPGANKLFALTRPSIFLGFPLDASGWVFYDPVTHQFFAPRTSLSTSQSVIRRAPRPSRSVSGVSHVTPQSSPRQRLFPVVCGGARGAVAEGEGTWASGAHRASYGGAGGARVETIPEEDTAVSTQQHRPASPPGFPSVPYFPPSSPPRPVAAEPGGVVGGGSGSGGAGAGDTSTATPTLRTVPAAAAVSVGASGESRGGVAAALAAAVSVGSSGESRGGVTAAAPAPPPPAAAAAVSVGASGESRGGVPAAAAAAVVSVVASGEGREVMAEAATVSVGASGQSRAGVLPAAGRADGPFHLVLRSRVASPPVLLQPPESSLAVLHDLLSDYIPVVSRVLSALVTHPSATLSSVSALVTTVAGFASSHRLEYAAHLRDPDALDIPIPRTNAEAVAGPWASYWIVAEEAEMASYRSKGTNVDAVPPRGANVVRGMWLYKVKRPPGAPPVFKARYVVRGFSQQEGVDFFQTFAPTPKITTLRVLLHIAAQRDNELHSLDFSTAFLQESLHRADLAASSAWFHWHFPFWDPVAAASTALDFFTSSADPSLFVRRGSTSFFVLVYVDDLVFATPDRRALASVKEELQRNHTCTNLGELQHYFGL